METEAFVIEIPSPLPAYGAETAAWIKAQILAHPELHNQSDWAVKTHCGTKRCIAGWAALLHGEVFDAKVQGTIDSGIYDYARESVEAENMGSVTWDEWVKAKASFASFEPVGREVLKLDEDETDRLFYAYNEENSLLALDLIIAGEKVSYDNINIMVQARQEAAQQ